MRHLTYDQLKARLEEVIDPGFNRPLREVNGIKKLVVGPTGVVELEVFVRDKTKYEQTFKIQLVKLIKIELGFPGVKVTIFESEFVPEGEKVIVYLAIASGKGGVGKSTVTANLAQALVRQNKKVGVIDADIYGASIPQIFQLEIKPLSSTDDEKMIPLNKDGVEVISTEFFMPPDKPLMWRGPMLGKMLIHYFNGVAWQDDIDIVLVDLPPGTGDVALDVKTYVPKSKVLVVTTPHVNAAHVAVKAGIGAQQIGHDVIGVVENMSYYLNPCNQKREFIFGSGGGKTVSEKLQVDLLGQIPIGQPLNDQYIFTGKEETGKLYDLIAKQIIEKLLS